MQRGLEADVPGPRVSFDIVLMSISGTSFKTFPTSLEIVETAPSVAFQRGAEEIVELNNDEKEMVGNLDAPYKDTNTNVRSNVDPQHDVEETVIA